MFFKAIRFVFTSTVLFAAAISVQAQTNHAATGSIDGHPAWIEQGNIYEVNVRQYTPEGTFKAFEKSLPRLKQMGAQTLWFMPINPISVKDRKGRLGSYYAVASYVAVNPEFGTMDDWKSLVKKAHSMGFKVILDWVPNHTGADHYWLTTHPDFYVKDKNGQALSPYDWTDTRKLNYNNPEMADSMIADMKFWIRESDIDGFRCDVAPDVPFAFWSRCIKELHQLKNVFMLAEGDKGWLHRAGFDATYPWIAFNMMKQIARGERPAFGLDSVLHDVDTAFPENALRMFFTSNHDENSWNKADYGTMPGASHAPFAVLTQTLKRSVPLVYSGQEEPVLDSISFFYKDTILFHNYARGPFYSTLLHLRARNEALAADAGFKKLRTRNDAVLYAFERFKNGKRVLVITNLSNQPQTLEWTDKPASGHWKNVFTNKAEPINTPIRLGPWGYKVEEWSR
jgi:alpha-amylase